ncbi:hypothetical protein [Chitinophaga sp. OAE865]|uniref:hypothetical protein n=1 Tax=Chitinophaga sp. OAE865 TaxID=2817898 RepID=UPI001AE1343F
MKLVKYIIHNILIVNAIIFLINPVHAQNKFNTTEVKKIEKTISKLVKLPADFKERKNSACFSIKFTFAHDYVLTQIASSSRSPSGLDSGLFNIKNYSDINWSKLFRANIKKASELIIVVSIRPDDSIDEVPNITHYQVDDLFNFNNNNDASSVYILPRTFAIQYGRVIK